MPVKMVHKALSNTNRTNGNVMVDLFSVFLFYMIAISSTPFYAMENLPICFF